MNDIYSGIHKGVFGSVFDKAKETILNAGETAKHFAHGAYELISGDEDKEDIDLEANAGFRRGYQAVHEESHHVFVKFDE